MYAKENAYSMELNGNFFPTGMTKTTIKFPSAWPNFRQAFFSLWVPDPPFLQHLLKNNNNNNNNNNL